MKLPHPHLAPKPKEEPPPIPEAHSLRLTPPPPAPAAIEPSVAEDWTPDLLPEWMRRPDAAAAWRSPSSARAEKILRSALWLGFCLNGAALLLPRLAPSGFEKWEYGGGDFLLAAAVLVSGRALLALGAHCRREP